MSRLYNSPAGADQVTEERGALSANPDEALPFYAGTVVESFANQDVVFSDAFAVLNRAIAARTFPGASIALTLGGKLVALKAFGRFTFERDARPVSTDAIFDLASVTKVVATTTAAMILYERGLLDLEAPVAGVLPNSSPATQRATT